MAQSDGGAEPKARRWRDLLNLVFNIAIFGVAAFVLADNWATYRIDKARQARERDWAADLGGPAGFPLDEERARARISKGYPPPRFDREGWSHGLVMKDRGLFWLRWDTGGSWAVSTGPDGRLRYIAFDPDRKGLDVAVARDGLRRMLWVVAPHPADKASVEAFVAGAPEGAAKGDRPRLAVDGGTIELDAEGGRWTVWAFPDRPADAPAPATR